MSLARFLAPVIAVVPAFLLSGCIILNSKAPLIARSDAVPALLPGSYLTYTGFAPSQAQQLDAAQRAQCAASPYRVPALDPTGQAMTERGPLLYCPFETGEKHEPSRPFALAATANGYVAKDPDKGMDLALHFQQLTDSFLIVQFDLSPIKKQLGVSDADNVGGYAYFLARPQGRDLEIYLVPCDSGMPPAKPEPGAAPAPAPLPPPKLKCDVKALPPIRPDLLAYAASPDAAPIAILKRTGE